MRKNLRSLLLLLPTLVLWTACGPTDDDDDPTPPAFPYLVEVSPPPCDLDDCEDNENFFYQANLWAEFNLVPSESATISLTDASGTAVAGTAGEANNGRVITFDPTEDLTPSTAYTMTIEWSPSDPDNGSPLVMDFATGPYGNPVNEPSSLVGVVYNIDLAGSTFVEPPGIGPILQSQIEGFAILFTPTAESDFEEANQPGLHIVGAIGEEEGGVISQDECTETLAFTYGADGIYGTADDVPASFVNPLLEIGPTDLPLSIQGIEATIQNLFISGTFHPELDDMQGGIFSGRIDTRPLAPELDPDGGENAICELVEETVGVSCVPCNEDGSEVFCLDVVAEDISAVSIPLTLTTMSCADIIGMALDATDPQCVDEALEYDPAGDGSYTDCALWEPPVTR